MIGDGHMLTSVILALHPTFTVHVHVRMYMYPLYVHAYIGTVCIVYVYPCMGLHMYTPTVCTVKRSLYIETTQGTKKRWSLKTGSLCVEVLYYS